MYFAARRRTSCRAGSSSAPVNAPKNSVPVSTAIGAARTIVGVPTLPSSASTAFGPRVSAVVETGGCRDRRMSSSTGTAAPGLRSPARRRARARSPRRVAAGTRRRGSRAGAGGRGCRRPRSARRTRARCRASCPCRAPGSCRRPARSRRSISGASAARTQTGFASRSSQTSPPPQSLSTEHVCGVKSVEHPTSTISTAAR